MAVLTVASDDVGGGAARVAPARGVGVEAGRGEVVDVAGVVRVALVLSVGGERMDGGLGRMLGWSGTS